MPRGLEKMSALKSACARSREISTRGWWTSSNTCGWCVTVKHPYCWWRSTLLLDSILYGWVESNQYRWRRTSLVGLYGELPKPFISLQIYDEFGVDSPCLIPFFFLAESAHENGFPKVRELPSWAFDVCDLEQEQESERFHHKKGTMV